MLEQGFPRRESPAGPGPQPIEVADGGAVEGGEDRGTDGRGKAPGIDRYDLNL